MIMTQAFDRAFVFSLEQEGGFVLSRLPGEKTETYAGIYRHMHPQWNGWAKIDAGDTISNSLKEMVKQFYFNEFWVRFNLEQLPAPLNALVFDFALNSGGQTAIKRLQCLLPVKEDGLLGAKTAAAARGLDGAKLNTRYIAARLDFLNDLTTWRDFGRGWSQRVVELLNYAAQ